MTDSGNARYAGVDFCEEQKPEDHLLHTPPPIPAKISGVHFGVDHDIGSPDSEERTPQANWLGLLACKTVSQITYTVLLETLNTAQSIRLTKCEFIFKEFQSQSTKVTDGWTDDIR